MGATEHTFEESVDFIFAECRKVLIDRQRKYGSSNIEMFKERGVVVRATDKLMRLKNFYFDNGAGDTPDETVDDTWIDLANYGIIALMVKRGLWGNPLELRDTPLHPATLRDDG